MFIDALALLSDAQAFGAAAVSTNSYDLGLTTPGRQVGTGEPLALGIQIDVSGTVAASLVEIISATDAALTAGILVHASMTIPLATAVAGYIAALGLPQGTPTQRYLGARITTASGTISATLWLAPFSMISIAGRFYPRNYAV
jgi:hypothetical protein